MTRKEYWLVLLNPFFLVLYGYGLSVAADFCLYGNVAKRLPQIAAIFFTGALWLIGWTALYFRQKKKGSAGKKRKGFGVVLAAELAVLIAATGWFGARIYRAAQPWSGKLGNWLSDLETNRTFSLEDSARNFPENGLDGILEALSEHCGLDMDWELYTAETLTLTLDEDGTIEALEGFLYAYDGEETFHSWVISYDAAKSDQVTVYLDGNTDSTYREQEQLAPLFVLIDALRNSELAEELWGSGNAGTLVLEYSGYTAGDPNGSWYLINEGTEPSLTSYAATRTGGANEGFLLTICRDGGETVTVASDIGVMETAESIQEREDEEAGIAEAKAAGKTLLSDDSGMTFYLDENTSMRLIVTDAAAGSRAYAFQNGDIYNADPFNGRYGVAESIYFLDESVGFLLLTSASQEESAMYYTRDGGESFTKVVLPVSDGAEALEGNPVGVTADEMDYINTPYEEGESLYVAVTPDASGDSALKLLFLSEDGGQSWQYLSCEW